MSQLASWCSRWFALCSNSTFVVRAVLFRVVVHHRFRCQFCCHQRRFYNADGGESNSSRGSFRDSLYALVPPGTRSFCPLLSNGVDLGLSPLLSLLLSCFWCMRNRWDSCYLQDKGATACQVRPLLFAYQSILFYLIYWQAVSCKVPMERSGLVCFWLFTVVLSMCSGAGSCLSTFVVVR